MFCNIRLAFSAESQGIIWIHTHNRAWPVRLVAGKKITAADTVLWNFMMQDGVHCFRPMHNVDNQACNLCIYALVQLDLSYTPKLKCPLAGAQRQCTTKRAIRAHVFTHVYTHVYAHVRIYACIHENVHTFLCTCPCTCLLRFAHVYAWLSTVTVTVQ